MSELEVREIRVEELDALARLRKVAFLDTMDWQDEAVRAHHMRYLPYRRGGFVEGELVCSMMWLPYEVYIDGEPEAVAALASVSTALEHRRNGHVRQMLHEGLERARGRGERWSLEYPFDTRYYEKFGWACVSNGSFYEVPTSWLRGMKGEGAARMRRAASLDEAREVVERVHAAYARRYTFMMTRQDGMKDWWDALCNGPLWRREPAHLYWSEEAYCVLELTRSPEGTRAEVLDMGYTTAQGRAAIWQLLGGLDGQTERVRMQLARGDERAGAWATFQVPHPHPVQARVVDVARVMAGRAGSGESLRMRVVDELCGWNDGVFELCFDGGSCQVARLEGEDRAALEVSVGALAQLMSGSVSWEMARDAGGLRGEEGAMARLGALASRRPVHLSLADYF